MKLKALVIVILQSFSLVGASQVFDGTPPYVIPRTYETPDGTIVPATEKCDGPLCDAWFVFSDRDNNPTYTDKDCTKPNGKMMSFMDLFYVVEVAEEGRKLLLVKVDGEIGETFGLKDVKWGWVDYSRMLLWRKPLVKKESRFTRKALVVTPYDESDSKIADVGKNVDVRNSPDSSSSLNDRDLRQFVFLFIYKVDGISGNMLVGLKPAMPDGEQAKEDMLGWVSSKDVQEWPSRLVLAPRDSDDLRARLNDKNIKVNLFKTKEAAMDFASNGKELNIYPSPLNDNFMNWDGTKAGFPRFPVFEQFNRSDNLILQAGVITGTYDSENGNLEVLSLDETVKMNEVHEENRSAVSKINIVIVMDAAENFSDKWTSIQKAILKISEQMESISYNEGGNEFNFALVLYGQPGTQPVETILKARASSAIKGYRDLVIERAGSEYRNLLGGLQHALQLPNLGVDETNVIVVFGNSGSTDADEKNLHDKVKNLLVEKSAALYAYKLVSGSDFGYQKKFTRQLQKLMEESASSALNSFREDKYTHVKIKMQQALTDRYTKTSLPYPDISPIPGASAFIGQGEFLDSDLMAKDIAEVVKNRNDDINKLKNNAGRMQYGTGTVRENNSADSLNMERSNFTDEQKKVLLNTTKKQLCITGWVPQRLLTEEFKDDLFEFQLLLTQAEFNELLNKFEKIADIRYASGTKKNEIAKACLIGLAEAFVGSESKEIMNLKASEVLEKIAQLPLKNKTLYKYTIAEIENMGSEELAEVATVLENMLKKIAAVKENDKKYSFKQEGATFYWLPFSVFQ
ncbi:MAG: type VI secretion system protein TssR [Flavobacteriales bacterium]|nr:type VI secretion system protein TssR [Flavobacteriales bacterium]